jgi:hypothetical protein
MPDVARESDDGMCRPCLTAMNERMASVATMQFLEGMTYEEAQLAAPPYRDILCTKCHSKYVRKVADA